MVINCPACATGFNLPEKHITAKGAKLRCSKCGHVFRVRRASPDDEIDFFYKQEDEQANEENGTSASESETNSTTQFGVGTNTVSEASEASDAEKSPQAAEEASGQDPHTVELEPMNLSLNEPSEGTGNRTNFGMPATDEKSKGGLFGDLNEEDPFPHAGGSLKDLFGGGGSKKEAAPSSEKVEAKKPEPIPEDSTQLGVITADASSPETPSPEQEALHGQTLIGTGTSTAIEEPPPEKPESSIQVAPEAIAPDPQKPDTGGLDLFEDEPAAADGGEDPFAGAFEDNSALDIDPLGSPAPEEEEEPILRPGQPGMALTGRSEARDVPTAKEDPPGLQQSSGASTADFWQQDQAMDAGGSLADPNYMNDGPSFDPNHGVVGNEPAQPAPTPQAKPQPRPQPRQQVASQGAKAAPKEEVWPGDIEALSPHKIGGSGLQKVANLILIVLVVLFGFLGVVAALNDGMLDFKQFGSMLGVAFGGEEYKPRAEWLPKELPKPVLPKEDVLRTQSVYAEIVPVTKKSKVLVLRGQVKNLDQQEYIDIKLRGLLLNSKGKILGEQEAPLGELIPNSKFTELSSMTELDEILPKHPKLLKVASTEHFTIVFDTIPKTVLDGEPILFRVEFAERVGAQDLK